MRLIVLLAILTISFTAATAQNTKTELLNSVAKGKEFYSMLCQSCHMEQGEGLEGVFPPLAKSDYLMADKNRTIRQILNGLSGPIKVNGISYEGEMPGYSLNDQEVADLMNFIRNSFGNKGGTTTPAEVAATRK